MTSPVVEEVIEALAKSKNVLLYGPPGTGKTWLVSELITYLNERKPAGGRPTLKLGATVDKFGSAVGSGDAEELPQKLEIEWVTFHQSYSYEEFIIGRRPKPQGSGIVLEPHYGILMNIAVNINQEDGNTGCLLIIDEINRANASQVFGEFITLLDPSYRATIGDNQNEGALEIRLPGIAYEDGISEEITMLRGGGKYQLPEDWKFPEHLYVLATMNSVDKAALPLDSALTRRFHRIEMMPDLTLLSQKLDVELLDLADKSRLIRTGENDNDLTAEETTILLLDRLNILISKDMGEDFELGHSLVWKVVDASTEKRWEMLISAWDHNILPQLVERYAGRIDALRDILKVAPDSLTSKAFYERVQIGVDESIDAPLMFNPLRRLDEITAKNILRQLAI